MAIIRPFPLIEYDQGNFHVVFANDTAHLNDDLSTFAHQSWWKGKDWRDIGLRFVPLDIGEQRRCGALPALPGGRVAQQSRCYGPL